VLGGISGTAFADWPISYRMGNDPALSVIDKYHRAHDVPNLFVCDGSSFVTSGRVSRR
jgi:choline dehydrogenase-like flavoprotein